MFLDIPAPFTPSVLWRETAKERCSALVARSRHVAFFCDHPDNTFRYRGLNMVEALNGAPGLDTSASWFTAEDSNETAIFFLQHADALVVCRTGFSNQLATLIGQANARGIPVSFDVDDLVFDPEYVPLVVHSTHTTPLSEDEWNWWFGYTGRYTAALRMCDSAITTSAYLAEHIAKVMPDMTVAVVPNFLNRQQASVSRALLSGKRERAFARDGHIDIGYLSGTRTHDRDLMVAAPALASVMDEFDDVRLRIVGPIELGADLARFEDRIQRLPFQDYLNLQRVTAAMEVNVAPLQLNAFTHCKSELKYFEPAAVGAVTVASPAYSFCNAITNGVNGFLAQPHEWYDQLVSIINVVRSDPDRHQELVERAEHDAHAAYGWDVHAQLIAAAVGRGRVRGAGVKGADLAP